MTNSASTALVIATGSAARDLPIHVRRTRRASTSAHSRGARDGCAPTHSRPPPRRRRRRLHRSRDRGHRPTAGPGRHRRRDRRHAHEPGVRHRDRRVVSVNCTNATARRPAVPSPCSEISADGRGSHPRFGDGLTAGGLVVAGAGSSPRRPGSRSGIAGGERVRCTADLRTNVPDVVAAGDVAQWHNSLFGEEMRDRALDQRGGAGRARSRNRCWASARTTGGAVLLDRPARRQDPLRRSRSPALTTSSSTSEARRLVAPSAEEECCGARSASTLPARLAQYCDGDQRQARRGSEADRRARRPPPPALTTRASWSRPGKQELHS